VEKLIYNLYKLAKPDRIRVIEKLTQLENIKSFKKTIVRVAWQGEKGYETYNLYISDAVKVIEQMQYKVDIRIWIL